MKTMRPTNIKMPMDLIKRAKTMRRLIGSSMSELVRRALDEYLTKLENQRNADASKR